MLATSWRLSRQVSAYSPTAIYLILAVVGLGLLLATGQPVHIHESDAPAFYNGECPFELAAHHGELNLPSPLPSVWIGLVEPFTPFVQFVAVVAQHSFQPAYRAPPLA